MPYIGRRLIRTDDLARADMLVVLSSYRIERTLEAGTLFREGWSSRILLLRSADVANNGTLRRLGIRVPVFFDIQKQALAQMGVSAAAIIETPMQDTTRAEADYVSAYARRMHVRRIIVVTSPYHTGRAGRFFRNRAGDSFEVIMRADRYEAVDPNRWWRHAGDRSDVVLEYLKTLYAFGSSPSAMSAGMK